MSERVQLVEVGPRDGLQNEAVILPAADKIAFVDALSEAGHERIEVTAFVSPKRVPQLADAAEVMAGIKRKPGVRYTALVPNEQGFERARNAGLEEIAIFTAASETFNRKNIGASIDRSFERFRPVTLGATRCGMKVRGYLSTVLHCPYEGAIPLERTVDLVDRLFDSGCHEVSLGETIGVAVPAEVAELCSRLDARGLLGRCAGHFHDTYGLGMANVLTAFEAGIRTFDASAGGMGGCPYAPGAAGNVATEDLVYLFQKMGVGVTCDLPRQVRAVKIIERALGRKLNGKTYRALASREED